MTNPNRRATFLVPLLLAACGGSVALESPEGSGGSEQGSGGSGKGSGGSGEAGTAGANTGGRGNSGSGGDEASGSSGSSGTPSVGGAGGTNPNGGSGNAGPDPGVTDRYRWAECGRIDASPARAVGARYALDGSILAVDERGALLSFTAGSPFSARVLVNPYRDGRPFAVGMGLSADGTRLLRWDELNADVFVQVDGQPIGATAAPLVALARAALSSSSCRYDTVVFSADAELLVAHGPSSVCVWDAGTGALRADIDFPNTGGPFNVRAAGIAGGTAPLRVVEGSTLRTFTLEGDPIDEFDLQGDIIHPVAFSPDAATLFGVGRGTLGTDADVVALDAQNGLERWRAALNGSPYPIVPNHAGLVLLGGDRVYRAEDGAVIADDPPSYPSSTADVAADGSKKLLVGDLLGEWELDGGEATLYGSHATRVTALDVSRDGQRLVSHGHWAVLWELDSEFAASTAVAQGKGFDGSWNVAIAPDGKSFVASGDNVALYRQDGSLLDGEAPPVITECFSADWTFSPDGQLVAGNRYTNAVEIRSAFDFSLVRTLPTTNCGGGVAFSRDGTLLVTASLELFETDTWKEIWDHSGGETPGAVLPPTEIAVEFSPDGREFVTTRCEVSSESCHSDRYALDNARPLSLLLELQGDRVRYSPEGHWVVSNGRALHLVSRRLVEFSSEATVAAFTPNGDIIAGTSDGSLIRYCRND